MRKANEVFKEIWIQLNNRKEDDKLRAVIIIKNMDVLREYCETLEDLITSYNEFFYDNAEEDLFLQSPKKKQVALDAIEVAREEFDGDSLLSILEKLHGELNLGGLHLNQENYLITKQEGVHFENKFHSF